MYVLINLPSINIGMCEENSVKNFLFFIQAGAGLSNRHRPKCPNSGSATLAMESNFSHFLITWIRIPIPIPKTRDATDIRPFLYPVSGRIPDTATGYPVIEKVGYPA